MRINKHNIMYMLLFMVPGLFASLLISLLITGVIAGAFWLFLFGDNKWPVWTDVFIPLCFGLIFLLSIVMFAFAGYKAGDGNTRIKHKHVVLSVAGSITFIAIFVLHSFKGEMQLYMTNPLVSKCMALCSERGYNGSSSPPENSKIKECSCFDDTINEWVVVQTDSD